MALAEGRRTMNRARREERRRKCAFPAFYGALRDRFHDPAEPAAHHRGESLVWPTGRGSVRCSVTTTDLWRRPQKIVHRPRLGKCLASLLSGYGNLAGRGRDPAIDYVVISDEAAISTAVIKI